jgi:hypothetical protein
LVVCKQKGELMNQKPSLILRIVAIVLLSLTAAMTLLGAIGTTCVAFNAEKYGPRMAALIPVKPIFQVLVFVSLAAGLFGVYSIVRLARGRRNSYNQTLIFLLVGLIASGVQYYYSLTLRGSTAPNNMRLYLTGLTLIVLLLLRLPGIWQRTGFGGGVDGGNSLRGASGLALLVCGLATITTPVWAAPTHIIDGYNTANVLFWPLLIVGALLILLGGICLDRGEVVKKYQKDSTVIKVIIK